MEKKTKNLILMDQIGIVQGGEYTENLGELKDVIAKLDNAALFLSYLIKELGFNPNDYEQILELNQDVLSSVSLLLKQPQQFLLSKKVDYDELHKADICGAYGYLQKEGLFIPESVEADDHFFGGYMPKGLRKRYCYAYPKIDKNGSEYDAVISNGISNADNFDLIFKSKVDYYLGGVLDINASNYEERREKTLKQLNSIRENLCALDSQISTGKDKDKELILLSRTR